MGFNSLIPAAYANSHLYSASRSEALKSYSNSSQSQARSQRLEQSNNLKMDKVTISEEAKQLQKQPRPTLGQLYNRLEKYRF